MENITLLNLENMEYKKIVEVKEILDSLMKYGVPSDFYDVGITIQYNPRSRCIFLTNENCEVAMLVNGVLTSWYFTPYEGHEGFIEDLVEEMNEEWCDEDIKYIADIVYDYYPNSQEPLEKKLKEIGKEEYTTW